MSRCRWVTDPSMPDGGFEVPGCWTRVINEDADCTCPTDDELMHQNEILKRTNRRLRIEISALEERMCRLETKSTDNR